MNDKQVFVISQSACAMITALGMQAENKQREVLGQSMAYTEQDFLGVIDGHGIGQNAVLLYLRD